MQPDGEIHFDWRKPRPPLALHGSWANVDGRLGVVMLNGAGMAYAQASRYSRGMDVYADILYGSSSQETRQFKTGQQVAHRVAIVAMEVSPRETATLAKSCRFEEGAGGRVLHFKSVAGQAVTLTLS